MKTGDMTEIITFRRKTEVSDGSGTGTLIGNYVPHLIGIWSKIQAVSGKEDVSRGGLQSNVVYRVTVRQPIDINANDIVLWKSQTYEIIDLIPPSEREMFMDFTMTASKT